MTLPDRWQDAGWPESERDLVPTEFCSMAADVEAFENQHKCIDFALKYLPLVVEAMRKAHHGDSDAHYNAEEEQRLLLTSIDQELEGMK